MYNTCIFDMDGSVADTVASIAYFANNALKKYGFDEIEKDTYKIIVGEGYLVLIERMLNLVAPNGYTKEQFDNVAEYFKNTYDDDFLYLTTAYDGIVDMMKELKKRNIKIGILTNKLHITAVQVADVLFGDLVDVVVGSTSGIPLKPDRRALECILQKIDARPEDILYIGDTDTDMKTGKSADAYTIGVTWGFRDIDELINNGADMLIHHPSDLIKFIDEQ